MTTAPQGGATILGWKPLVIFPRERLNSRTGEAHLPAGAETCGQRRARFETDICIMHANKSLSNSLAALAARLRVHLRLLMAFLAMPSIALVAWLAVQERQAVIETHLVRTVAVADSIVETQEEPIFDTRRLLREIALSPAVHAPSAPACGAYLSAFLALRPEFANFGVPRADGELLCNATPLSARINVADRDCFRRAIETRSFSIGSYQIDRAARPASINFAYPVFAPARPDAPVGAAVAVISLDWWNKALRAAGLPEDSRAHVLDPDGRVVASFPATAAQDSPVPETFPRDTAGAPRITDQDGQRRVVLHRVLMEAANGDRVEMRLDVPVDASLAGQLNRAMLGLVVLITAVAVLWWFAERRFERGVLEPLGAAEREFRRLEQAEGMAEPAISNAAPEAGVKAVPAISQLTERVRDLWLRQRQAERAEQVTTRRLAALLSALPDLFFRLDHTGHILDFEAGKQTDLFRPPEAFLGRKMHEVLPSETARDFALHLQRLKEKGDLQSWDYQLRVQGRLKDFEARALPVPRSTEILIVICDITLRKEAERHREAVEAPLTEILENHPRAVISMDIGSPDELETVHISPGCRMIWGYGDAELMADPDLLIQAHDPDDLPLMREALLRSVRTLVPETRRFWLRDRDGARKWVEVHIGARPFSDGQHRVTTFAVDISREIEAEQQLDEQRELAFRAMKHENIGQLTGSVAHDFNNLLAVIMGNLELLRDGLADAEQIALIDRGISAAQRGAELTLSMLSFARQARLDPVEIDLNALVSNLRGWTDRTLPDNIRVETDLEAALWPVEADPASRCPSVYRGRRRPARCARSGRTCRLSS